MKAVAMPTLVTPDHLDYTRELFSVSAAAAYLVTSRDAIYREAHAGRIGHMVASRRRLLFSQQDLDVYRASLRKPARTVVAAPAPRQRRSAPSPACVLDLPKERRFA
jgi:excisionase family DNA binding protein